MGYNLASTAACSSARHARVGSRKRKIADVDAALTLLSIEKMQPPRTDEQTEYHTVTVGEQAIEQAVVPAIEQAVEPAIEQAVVQAVEQVIDDRIHAQESQTDVTAEDISYLEEDNRARVAESSEPTFFRYDRGCYVGAPEKACFYTGLPSVEILDVVFELVEQPTHDKFRETYAIQSDVVVSNSATNELPFQGHRLSTSHLLVDRAKILSRHT